MDRPLNPSCKHHFKLQLLCSCSRKTFLIIIKFKFPKETITTIITDIATCNKLIVKLDDALDWPKCVDDFVYFCIETNDNIRLATDCSTVSSFDFSCDRTCIEGVKLYFIAILLMNLNSIPKSENQCDTILFQRHQKHVIEFCLLDMQHMYLA